MATVKKTKALLDAEKRIVELEKQLASEKQSKDNFYKMYNEQNQTIDGIHDILDDLGIKGFKDDQKYYRIPLAVRLFSWAMKLNAKN